VPFQGSTASFPPASDYLDGLIDEAAAAEFLGYTPRALQNWRVRGGGPKFVRVSSRSIRYRRRDLIEWAESRLRCSTSEMEVPGKKNDVSPVPVRQMQPIDFPRINAIALTKLPDLLRYWLPDGRREGAEYVARNPRRDDRSPGSFKVNLINGRWADFAIPDARGGDPVSLYAYLFRVQQSDAAREIARLLGVDP